MYITLLLFSIFVSASAITAKSLWDIFDSIVNIEEITSRYVPEDAKLNISELANKYGYHLEEYPVITEDGYKINVHRIRGKDFKERNFPVVFLMHGILESSDCWVLQGPNKSLAYMLADEGFDVWMGNSRGNKHALKHTTLEVHSQKFWNFTWEEIGLFDLSAMIDYTLRTTDEENLYYVGHSQGTTSAYVLLSMKPEYNKKIKAMFSLAPEAWMGNIKSPFVKMFAPASSLLGYLLHDFNSYAPSTEVLNKISAVICSVLPVRCDNFLYAITGYENSINQSLLPLIFGHMPTGASTLQFLHYGQLAMADRFCRFDYGSKKNLEVYGQNTPPDYDLNNISTPMVIYYSTGDWLSDPNDVGTLKSHLPNVYAFIHVGNFSHLDYTYSSEAVDTIYNRIIVQIRKFEKENYVKNRVS